MKPGQKVDIFEKRLIDSIKNNYLENFKPDKIIEIYEIFKFNKYNNKNQSKYKDEIEKFSELFLSSKIKLAIKHKKSPAML